MNRKLGWGGRALKWSAAALGMLLGTVLYAAASIFFKDNPHADILTSLAVVVFACVAGTLSLLILGRRS